ncbi:hypothetical protein [Nitriliruptor alkaliphilus]|uniref:hypothetical protein n=1 Tax=Nitriliruptor alkaliphilus TaxID=427918 RepID=UPI000696BFFB|nr:hypothetical protein [Nitriliruptor alkaliphilus]
MLLVLLVWVVYLLTATYTVSQVNDSRATSLMAWSLGTRGTVALPEEWRGYVPWEAEGVDGSLHTDRFPGSWLWAAPFYTVSEAVLDRGTPPHPWLLNYAPSGVASATAAALAIGVSFMLFRRLAARRLALGAALVLAFATGVWSVSANVMWTHGLTHLTLSLGLLAAAGGRDASSGLAFAAAILTRPQTAVVPAVVGLWRGASARRIRPVVVIGILSALGLLGMVIYSRAYFGTWIPVAGYTPGKVTSVATISWRQFGLNLAGGLADPHRGLLVFTPFLFVFAPFIGRGWRASEWWVKAGALGGLAYFVVQMRANGYQGGAQYYGSRLSLELLVLAAPLLLRTWQAHLSRVPLLRRAVLGLIVVSFTMHAVGATILRSYYGAAESWHPDLAELCEQHQDFYGCVDPTFPVPEG